MSNNTKPALACCGEPLRKGQHVRGGVQSHPVPALLKDGGHHGSRRSLAIRASDVDDIQIFLGISKDPGDVSYVGEAKDHAKPLEAVKIG